MLATMPPDMLRESLRQTMADAFLMDETELPDEVSQDTCARWTSLGHMTLMASLEERFGVTLSMDDMLTMTSFDRIVDVLSGTRLTA